MEKESINGRYKALEIDSEALDRWPWGGDEKTLKGHREEVTQSGPHSQYIHVFVERTF